MSTLPEIKAAAEKLSLSERRELALWLSEADDLRASDLEDLRREIQLGLDDVENGHFAPLDLAQTLREAREEFEAAGR
jgi:hypothetical protein